MTQWYPTLAYGRSLNPRELPSGVIPSDVIWKVLHDGHERLIVILVNDSGTLLMPGDHVKYKERDAIVEDGYKGGVPPGFWHRAVVKSKVEELIERIDELLTVIKKERLH